VSLVATSDPSSLGSSTACWVYAVVDETTDLPDGLHGVGDAAVRLVPFDGLAAVVGDVDVDHLGGGRHDLLAHHQVLEQLLQLDAVVPVQFGSVLDDEDTVRDGLLREQEALLREVLETLRGRVQVNLRARYVEDAVLAEVVRDDPEVAALRRVTREESEEASYGDRVRLGQLVSRAVERKREDDSAWLLDQVLPLAVAYSLREATGTDLLDVALLVDAERQQELEDLLEAIAEGAHERIRLQLVGPVVALDFAGGV
jgi:hypothetical protein